MQLSTKTIIKLLPFEEKFKTDLLDRFDTLSDDQKFNAEQLVWKAYAAMYDVLLQENIQVGLEEIKDGKEMMDEGFYQRMDERTTKQMETQGIQKTELVDMTTARHELEEIMKATS